MAVEDSVWCNIYNECYNNRWSDWGRWAFLGFIIIAFFCLMLLCGSISARRRVRMGQKPFIGTGWLVPKRLASQNYGAGAPPGPPGPAGYYPPQSHYDPNSAGYPPPAPPYTPGPQYTGTTDAYRPEYFPASGNNYEMSNYYGSAPPPVPVATHPTGASTGSYVQSNNPFQPPPPPPVHTSEHALKT